MLPFNRLKNAYLQSGVCLGVLEAAIGNIIPEALGYVPVDTTS